jgi:hypothetical protein
VELGEFGFARELDETRKPGEETTVVWYGQKIRLVDLEEAGILPLMEFMDKAVDVKFGEPAGLAAMYRLFEQLVHPDDWKTFRETPGVDFRVAVELAKGLIGVMTGRPTQRPSESAGGPPATGPDSEPTPPVPPGADPDFLARQAARQAQLSSWVDHTVEDQVHAAPV